MIARYLSATALASLTLFAAPSFAQTVADSDTRPVCPEGAASDRTDCRMLDAPTNPQSSTPQPPSVDATGAAITDQRRADVNADGTTANDGEITVTGSRVRLRGIEGIAPGFTIGTRYLQDRGLTNVADAINEIPGIRGSITPAGAQGSFGQGVNFVNGFGLGSNRTLTLVNGRRYVTSNVNTIFNQGSAGTQVDVNVIPTLLVDRVEQLTIQGVTAYGSDAIAATFNYILNTRLDGIIASATSEITEEGDRFRYNAAIAGGMNFADGRGNITLAYTRDRVDGQLYNSRDYLRQNIGSGQNPTTAQLAGLGRPAGTTFANDGRLNPNIGYNDTASDGFPDSVLIRDRTLPLLTVGGLITAASRGATFTTANSVAAAVQNLQFDTSGNLVPFNRGIRFANAQQSSGGDGFRFNDYLQLTSNVKRDIFNGFATFDVTDNITLFAEGTYFHSRGDELVQQPTFNSSLFAGLSGQLTFNVNSPFLTTQARNQLTALGVQNFQVSRASADLADLTGFSTNDLYRIVVGERGKFNVGEREFNWELSGNYGRVNIADTGQELNAQNFINAVNVTRNVSGQIVCTTTPTVQAAPGGTPVADPSCVPLNLLGAGLSSPEARAYVIATNKTKSTLQQTVFNANVGGSPFDLFGNQIGFNVGYEHRQEEGSFTPSDFQQRGLGRSVAILPVAGKYNVDEAFGEVIAPIITPANNLRYLYSLQLQGGIRYVDNTVNGGFTAYSGQGRVSWIRDFSLRATYARSFRAPAITELFSPNTNTFTSVTDLCTPASRNAGPAPAVRARNCAAFLAAFPNATPLDAAAATVPGRSGGNPTLDNEVSDSFSYGIVLEPRFVPGLSISVDYVNIKIKNPISNLSVATIASACFDNTEFNTADPANGNAFCSQIRRYARGEGGTAANGGDRGGQVVVDPINPGVSSGFVNGNRIKSDFIQAALDYNRSLSGLGLPGRIGIDGTAFYLRRRINDITGVAPSRSDGILGDPEWQGQLNLRYVGEGFGVTGSFNYTGEQLFSRFTRTTDIREIDQLDDFVTINPSMYFDVQDKFRFTISVTNLLNRVGQKYYGVIIPASYSDLLGRRFAVTARAKF